MCRRILAQVVGITGGLGLAHRREQVDGPLRRGDGRVAAARFRVQDAQLPEQGGLVRAVAEPVGQRRGLLVAARGPAGVAPLRE